MSGARTIIIVGGGLAGLTLGIGLRRRNVPTTIWEAGHYPRHKVCGEFISGCGQQVLEKYGLTKLLKQAGATLCCTAQFHFGKTGSPVRQLRPAALCLSRFVMDHVLAQHFSGMGGELLENRRWTGAKEQAGIVFANGRRTQQVENGWRWFGLKTHAHQVHLDADLEMHGSMRGYVGLCRLPEGGVNVCGLFRARRGAVPNNPKDLLRGENGTALHDRLARAVFDEDSFCSVAGLSLRPQRAIKDAECRLGDALTMIPPVTGNGMSMALESADIAVEPISQFAHRQISWEAARSAIAQGCDARFRTRLFWAKWLQMLILCRAAHGPMAKWVLNSAALWRLFFALTR